MPDVTSAHHHGVNGSMWQVPGYLCSEQGAERRCPALFLPSLGTSFLLVGDTFKCHPLAGKQEEKEEGTRGPQVLLQGHVR